MICRVKNLLLSYPRSGNTWIRYFVEYVSKMPTRGCGGAVYDKYTRKSPHNINYNSKAILQKEHFARQCRFHNQKTDNIILLIRNPKETLIRHHGTKVLRNKKLNVIVNKFMNNLALYDNWSSNKMIIYYEDVVDNFGVEAEKITNFLKLDMIRCKKFLLSYDDHKNKCIEIYSKKKSKSITQGNKKIYYSKFVGVKGLERIDNIIKKTYNNLYKKYLIRYD